ncbi:hypothetical protein Tco_0805420 [Tanacetum coccineum]
MKKVDRGITLIDHTHAKAMGKLSNVLCQVGVTIIIAKFLILDIPIDRDAPIVVGWGFLPARFDVLRTTESDSNDEEEYVIKRNKFGVPIYGLRPASYLNCANPKDRSSAIQAVTNPFRKISVWKKAVSFLGSLPVPLKQTLGTHDGEAGSSQSKRSRNETVEEDVLNRMGCDGEIDDMLGIWVQEAESEEEIFTSVAWIRAFNINELIYVELCHEFYSTYEFDKVCADDELQSKKIIRFRLGGRAHSLTLLEFARRLGLYQAVELEEDGFNVYFKGGEVCLRTISSVFRNHFEGDPQIGTYVFVSDDGFWVCQGVEKNVMWLLKKGAGDSRRETKYVSGQFISKLARKCRVLTEDVEAYTPLLRSLHSDSSSGSSTHLFHSRVPATMSSKRMM